MDEETEVVVVGAGPAGLRVASRLSAQGVRPVLLEARDRVGGRLLSPAIGDGRLDLGATWFWPNEQRMDALAKELELQAFVQDLSGDTMFQSAEEVVRLSGNRLDVPAFRLNQGTQVIAEALAESLPKGVLHLSSPVRGLALGKGHLLVASHASTYRAEHVVIAVPPATALFGIGFGPLLSDSVRALAERTPVWMGAMTKVVAHYETRFWRDVGLSGAAFSQVGPMREIHDMSGPGGQPAAIFGFASPPAMETVSHESVLQQLGALFGTAATAPLSLHIQDWRTETYTSLPGVGDLSDYTQFGHPLYRVPALDGRLHWASTETSSVAPGHIEGALAAADRAAENVLRALAS